MKTKDIERVLAENGYCLVRNSKHKIYSNGTSTVAVPHTNEVNKMLSKHILKQIQLSVVLKAV